MATKSLIFDIVGRDKSASAAISKVSTGILGIGAASGAALGLAVAKFSEFDQQMSLVQDGTRASAQVMGDLRDAALDAGARTAFSATEAAAAVDALARAGVSTSDILSGALDGALDLAAAGSLDVAKAAEIASVAMVQFKLAGQDVPHIADLLAAGAGKAMGTVEDLAMALDQSGLVASQAGLSIEETTGTLAAFASAGLAGSDGGTSFKTMLQRLTPVSANARAKMEELGISAFDASGEFVGITNYAGQLRGALSRLTPEARQSAMGIMFGSDAVRAAAVLYEQGAEGIENWIDETNDAGYAAESAAIKMDNLAGDVEQLGGAVETSLIKAGSGANDVLRQLTQTATDLVSGFAGLPDPVQQTAFGIMAVTTGAGLLVGGTMKLIPAIDATRSAMRRLDMSGGSLAKTIGKGGLVLAAIAAGTAGIAGLGRTSDLSAEQLARLDSAIKSKSLDTLNAQFKEGAVVAGGYKAALTALQSDDFSENMSLNAGFGKFMAGLGIDVFYKELRKSEAAFLHFGTSIANTAKKDFPAATGQFNKLVDAYGGGEEAARRVMNALGPDFKAALIEAASAYDSNVTEAEALELAQGKGAVAAQLMRDAAARNTSALADMSSAAQDTSGKVQELADQISGFGSAQFDVERATIEFHEALSTLSDLLNPGEDGSISGSLDVTTEAGQRTLRALLDSAQATNELAGSTYAMGGTTEQVQGILESGRQKLIETRIALGDTEEGARAYADQLIATPTMVATQVQLNGIAEATQALAAFRENESQKTIRIGVTTYRKDDNGNVSFQVDGTDVIAQATGGPVVGPGRKGVDSLLRMLAPGEHVITADEVDAAGGHAGIFAIRAAIRAGTADKASMIGAIGPAPRSVTRATSTSSTPAPIAPARGRGSSTVKKVEKHIHFHNPVTRDPLRSAQEAADLIGVDDLV